MDESPELTVVVRRTIKEGQAVAFESKMKEFVRFALDFDGHKGITVIRPSGGGREYIVVDRFADQEARDRFTASPEYEEWMRYLDECTEQRADIQELSGLETWFSDHEGQLRPIPRYKMAVVTWIAVCLVILALNAGLAPYISKWGYIPQTLFYNACVVILLTWVVMPALTRVFRRWLFKKN